MEVLFRQLEEGDIQVMGPMIEDDGMEYCPEHLRRFFRSPNTCAFGAFADKELIGMAYCYFLPRLDGKTMFFLYSIGLLPQWQNQGIGSRFMDWLSDYGKGAGCSELFVITDKGNPRACRIYEKAGGKNDYDDEIVYVIDYEKR